MQSRNDRLGVIQFVAIEDREHVSCRTDVSTYFPDNIW